MIINIDDEIKKIIGSKLIVFEYKNGKVCNTEKYYIIYNASIKRDIIKIQYRIVDTDTKCYISNYIEMDKKDFISLLHGNCVYGKNRLKRIQMKKGVF